MKGSLGAPDQQEGDAVARRSHPGRLQRYRTYAKGNKEHPEAHH